MQTTTTLTIEIRHSQRPCSSSCNREREEYRQKMAEAEARMAKNMRDMFENAERAEAAENERRKGAAS